MNTDTIETIIDALNKIEGAPAIALVLLSCLAVGYALRFIRRFPNDGIPVAVILWGAAFMPLLSDFRTSGIQSLRVWIIRNLVVGLIVGFVAWLVHNLILSKVEDWISSKVPALGKLLENTKEKQP